LGVVQKSLSASFRCLLILKLRQKGRKTDRERLRKKERERKRDRQRETYGKRQRETDRQREKIFNHSKYI